MRRVRREGGLEVLRASHGSGAKTTHLQRPPCKANVAYQNMALVMPLKEAVRRAETV